MRIVIDARYVQDHFPGIGRYLFNLLRELAALPHRHTIIALHHPALPNTRHPLAALAASSGIELVATTARPFSAGEQWAVPRLLRRVRADLFHAPYYVRPYAGLPCPVAVTLYDAIPRLFPAEVSFRARTLFDLLSRLAVRDAARVFTISNSARDDLVAAYQIPPERMIVTPLAADARFVPPPADAIAALRVRHGLPPRYVLAVGSNKPHKNLGRLIEAYAQVMHNTDAHLVIAGHWDRRYAALRDQAQAAAAERIHLLPNVAEAELPALYGGAAVFAFPSLYEGFGLPPLEAMACGAPVLCGASSSLPEVTGGTLEHPEHAAAWIVDVRDAAAIRAGLQRLLHDPPLCAALRERGTARAALFSWRRTAEATMRGYQAIMER